MNLSSRLARVALGLVLSGAGCAGEPAAGPAANASAAEPAQAAPAVARPTVEKPAAQPAPKVDAARRARLDAAAKRMLERAFPVAPEPAELPETFPGDGQLFPVLVELRSARTGNLMPGILTASWRYASRHPRTPKDVWSPKQWTQSEDGAAMDCPGLVPSLWRFDRLHPDLGDIEIETSLWAAPESGKLIFTFDDFTLRGRVVAHDGRPLPGKSVRLMSFPLDLTVNEPGFLHHASITDETLSGPDGVFELPGLHRGRYWVRWSSIAASKDGREHAVGGSATLELKSGMEVTLGPKGVVR